MLSTLVVKPTKKAVSSSVVTNGKRKASASKAKKAKKPSKLRKLAPKQKTTLKEMQRSPVLSPSSDTDSSLEAPMTPVSFAPFLPPSATKRKLTESALTEVDLGPIDHPPADVT